MITEWNEITSFVKIKRIKIENDLKEKGKYEIHKICSLYSNNFQVI